MIPCAAQPIEVGPVLAILIGQALTLGAASFSAWNSRRNAEKMDAVAHSQSHLRASLENLGTIDPAVHKEGS